MWKRRKPLEGRSMGPEPVRRDPGAPSLGPNFVHCTSAGDQVGALDSREDGPFKHRSAVPVLVEGLTSAPPPGARRTVPAHS